MSEHNSDVLHVCDHNAVNMLCNPNGKFCSFWVERKKRFCKQEISKGLKYCGEHGWKKTTSGNNDANPPQSSFERSNADSTNALHQPNRNPNEKYCSFWVEKKTRFCRHQVAKGRFYCVQCTC